MPACSIVVPVYNRAALTRECLDALLSASSSGVASEIIVVDDASADETSELLASYAGRVRVVRRAANGGYAAACNDGAAVATAEYVVFLNNDTLPTAGWLAELVGYATTHPRAAAVGSKLLYPDGSIQHAGVAICQDRIPRHLYRGFPADHPAVNKSRSFQIVTAACVLIRRAAFQQVGGFDATFHNGYEDVDLCLRLGERGHEVHYCHRSVLYHLEGATRGWSKRQDRRNARLYLRRWGDQVTPDDLHYYLSDGLLSIRYSPTYPIEMELSPLLAGLAGNGRDRQADRLLALRSRQVYGLLQETVRLRVAGETGTTPMAGPSLNWPRPVISVNAVNAVEAAGADTAAVVTQPRVLFRGTPHRLGREDSGRLISVILPVKNGAAQLRGLLPRMLSQDSPDSLEIIAIDSGSSDETLQVLEQFSATVLAIPPETFNHGVTRNLAASHAAGEVLVFVNKCTLPADDRWLANLIAPLDHDPDLAGVCSRMLPRPDADLLTARDGRRDLTATSERSVRMITDWAAYAAQPPEALRRLISFHTVSAAIRSYVLAQIPFRAVSIMAEDLQWAKDVLEAGFKIQHEPSSVVLHSHDYSPFEILQQNFDDGIANREIVGRQLHFSDVLPQIVTGVRDDWRYLETECRLAPAELERWRIEAVIRRTAQVAGQWAGLNHAQLGSDLTGVLSRTGNVKTGTPAPARIV